MVAREDRYIPNTATTLSRVSNPQELLLQSLETVVTKCPPANANRKGLFAGPTSIAYLFYYLQKSHPDLSVKGKSPTQWMNEYLALPEPEPIPEVPELSRCGLFNELLCSTVVKAVATRNDSDVKRFLALATRVPSEGDKSLNELLLGSPGTLMMLRLIRTHVPGWKEETTAAMVPIIKNLLERRPWTLKGNRYIGAAHGDIGIIVQIVLSDPTKAKELESNLIELLDLQLPDGNWPVAIGEHADLVHWCHGAPGFVVSLEAIKECFPSLREKIEQAIDRGPQCTWELGLLKKEPNLCHGITGNALALVGEQKEHFLAMTTPDKIGSVEWEPSNDPWCLYKGEAGRAWVWATLDGGNQGFPGYTEV